MKTHPLMIFIITALLMQAPVAFADAPGSLDPKVISKATDTQATVKPDGVVRIGWQREDVPVMVDGVKLPTPAGLGSWAAFKAVPEGGVMLMGDTVVFEDEITSPMVWKSPRCITISYLIDLLFILCISAVMVRTLKSLPKASRPCGMP